MHWHRARAPAADLKPDNTVVPENTDMNNAGLQVNFSNRSLNAGLDVQVAGISGYELQDGDYLPLVKITPIYPRRAAARGLEGWVLVSFTITSTGTVEDVVVEDSSHALFERSAVQAAYKFKYRPRIVDGVPMAVTGVKHLLRFVIEQ